MLRPFHHDRRVARHPLPAAAAGTARPADVASEPLADKPSAPPLSASEKADLFRRFDSYMGHPGGGAGSTP